MKSVTLFFVVVVVVCFVSMNAARTMRIEWLIITEIQEF